MEKLDKDGFAHALADKTGYGLGDCRHFVDCLIDVFADAIINETQLDVRGWGKLYYQTVSDRDGAKPTKGIKGKYEKMHYPPTIRVIFKLSSNLRNLAKMELVNTDDLEEV